MLVALNSWRVQQGLWPLKANSDLDQLAQAQAAYLLTLPSLPEGGDIHRGQNGEWPLERAQKAGWPFYNTSAQTAVTEIAYVGATVDAAIAYWRSSDIHNRSVSSNVYREVGIAALPHSLGTLFIIFFGARPDGLPALLDPSNGLLYLSNEYYQYAAGGNWINNATRFQIVDSPEAPIDEAAWQPWRSTVTVPASGTQPFYVVYSDGTHQLSIEVYAPTDVAWLPSNMDLLGQTVAQAPAPVAPTTPPPAPTSQAAAPTPTPQPAAQPPASGGTGGQVGFFYGPYSLTIVNVSSGPLDLTGLEIVYPGGTLPVTKWDTEYLVGSLNAFPANDCLQVWPWDFDDPGTTPACRYRRSVIYTAPGDRFWATGDFEVRWRGTSLGTCAVGAGRCDVNLP